MNKDEIKNLIKDIVEKTTVGFNGVSVSEEELLKDSKPLWFSVEVRDPHYFIERGGEGLAALNHLVRRIIESKEKKEDTFSDSGVEIMVDINGFQKKRIENIHAVAHMMAERARYFKSNIEVDPMPAFERRIVHEFLSNETDLKTESQGEGHSRRVVIKYIGTI